MAPHAPPAYWWWESNYHSMIDTSATSSANCFACLNHFWRPLDWWGMPAQAFMASLESRCKGTTALQHLRTSAAFATFQRRWNTAAYFSLLLQDVAGAWFKGDLKVGDCRNGQFWSWLCFFRHMENPHAIGIQCVFSSSPCMFLSSRRPRLWFESTGRTPHRGLLTQLEAMKPRRLSLHCNMLANRRIGRRRTGWQARAPASCRGRGRGDAC
jgi:hypothetical protein